MIERPTIQEEIEQVRSKFPDLKVVGDEGILTMLPKWNAFTLCWSMNLPKGKFNMERVMVAFDVPPGYPGPHPYNFYTDPDLRLGWGGYIRNSTHGVHPRFKGAKRMWATTTYNSPVNVQIVIGHVQMWDPNRSSLFTYAMVIKQALYSGWLSREPEAESYSS